MTVEQLAEKAWNDYWDRPGPKAHPVALLTAVLAAERERCALVAEAQPLYPDTHTGTRQGWVKRQIAAAIREGRGP